MKVTQLRGQWLVPGVYGPGLASFIPAKTDASRRRPPLHRGHDQPDAAIRSGSTLDERVVTGSTRLRVVALQDNMRPASWCFHDRFTGARPSLK